MISAFVNRQRWTALVVFLICGPVVGMLYLGKGRNAVVYFLVGIVVTLLPFAAAHLGLIGNPELFLVWPLHVAGAVHGYFIANKMAGDVPRVWFARWYGILALGVLLPTVAALPIRCFLWEPFFIPARSMEPTLIVGDYLFVYKFAYGYSRFSLPFAPPLFSGRLLGQAPARGDIAVFKLPSDGKTDFIKRIVGLPGDRVQYRGGRLLINGSAVDRQRVGTFGGIAHYIEILPNGRRYSIAEETDTGFADNTLVFEVPEGHYFALGDNRDNSLDSRFPKVGFIPYENLVGPLTVVFWNSETRKLMFETRD